ncbi:hypothetical protein CLAIMM_05982 [Cladophialophora immunda]|nr:hypothetical protein CLAIMM_05982 [Cladophialophora immunda]
MGKLDGQDAGRRNPIPDNSRVYRNRHVSSRLCSAIDGVVFLESSSSKNMAAHNIAFAGMERSPLLFRRQAHQMLVSTLSFSQGVCESTANWSEYIFQTNKTAGVLFGDAKALSLPWRLSSSYQSKPETVSSWFLSLPIAFGVRRFCGPG